MSTIAAGTTTTTTLVHTGDTTGNLVLQTNNTGSGGTTAITIDTSQRVTLANTLSVAGAVSVTGALTTTGSVNAPNTFGFKNRIINGGMVIDQRNAGASVAFTTAAYTLDRWVGAVGTATGTTIQRSTTSTTGFSNSALITIGTGASPAAGAVNRIYQVIEGFNIADLAWGTASAATVTLSFWVRSSVTGTFSGALYGASTIQSYPFNYTISAANTFEQKTVTIAGPTTGTWDSTNGTGIYVNFDLGSGTTFKGTAGAWATGTFIGVTGATNLCATTGATFYITGVQLETGSTATSFDYRPYGTELALCQRYCFVPASNSRYVGQCDATTRALIIYVFPQTMRSGPNATLASAATYNVTTAAGGTVAGTSVSLSGGYTDTAQVAISVASGLVAGDATLVTASGTTIFSAEL